MASIEWNDTSIMKMFGISLCNSTLTHTLNIFDVLINTCHGNVFLYSRKEFNIPLYSTQD